MLYGVLPHQHLLLQFQFPFRVNPHVVHQSDGIPRHGSQHQVQRSRKDLPLWHIRAYRAVLHPLLINHMKPLRQGVHHADKRLYRLLRNALALHIDVEKLVEAQQITMVAVEIDE